MSSTDLPKQPELPEDVTSKLDTIKQKNPDGWILRFFNNFQHDLPDGYMRAANATPEMMDQSPSEGYASDFKKSVSYRTFFAHIDAALERHTVDVAKVRELMKKLKNVPKSSNPTVEAEINTNRELVRQMRDEGMSDIEIGTMVEIPPSEEEHTQQTTKLWDILSPVYADLRALGYSHYDLTGIMPEQICPTPSPASS